MNKVLTFKNIFIFSLLIWMVSIPFKNAIYQISTVLLIVIFFTYVYKNKDLEHIKKLFDIYKDIIFSFLFIVLCMTISNFTNNTDGYRAWEIQLAYIYRYGFILFILFYFYSREFFSKDLLFLFIFISLSIQAFDGLYQFFIGYDFFRGNLGNLEIGLSGGTFNRNVFCIFMGLGVIFSFFIIKKEKFNMKFCSWFFLLILFLFCALFSYSRSVWVALFISFIIYTIFNFRNIKKIHLIYFFICIVVLGLLFYNIDTLFKRFELLIDGYSSHRYKIWSYSFKLFLEQPFLGWGLDAWSLKGLKDFANVHNSSLEILINIGILGYLSFFIFMTLSLKELMKIKDVYLFVIFVYLFVISQFEQSILTSKTFITPIVLLVFYIFVHRIENLKKEQK